MSITPLRKVAENVYVKLESFLPTGSIKQRMVQAALANEQGRAGSTMVVPSSGNTAAAAALWARAHGVQCVVVVPARCTDAKLKRSRVLGAHVVVAPSYIDYRKHALDVMRELTATCPDRRVWMFDQYRDQRNADAYVTTLAPELAQQARELNLDRFAIVLTASTGGTLLGLSKYNWFPGSVQFALAEPSTKQTRVDGAALASEITLEGARNAIGMCVPVSDAEALLAFEAYKAHQLGMSGAMAVAAALRVRACLRTPVIAICADHRSTYIAQV